MRGPVKPSGLGPLRTFPAPSQQGGRLLYAQEGEDGAVTGEEDMIKFHNGDTLDSIPVIRPWSQSSRWSWRVGAGVLGVSLCVGSILGWSLAMGERSHQAPSAAPSSSAPVAAPAVTVTATATTAVTVQPTYEESESYGYPYMEQVYVKSAPSTGGDPGTDYCFSYLGGASAQGESVILLSSAPAYQCQDYLFSTHPRDGVGVFELVPPNCSGTPGGRTAQVTFDPFSGWDMGVMYTCLLFNDGA